MIETFMLSDADKAQPLWRRLRAHLEDRLAQARIRNPFHRLTTPEDVAETILGLCGPTLRWANGTIIRTDGGEAISGL